MRNKIVSINLNNILTSNQNRYASIIDEHLIKQYPDQSIFSQKSYYKTVHDYYMNHDFEKTKKQIKQTAHIVSEGIPSVRHVYGVGFPFYGNVDIRHRIAKTISRYEDGEYPLDNLIQRMLPDIDLLLVFHSDDIFHLDSNTSLENQFWNSFQKSFAYDIPRFRATMKQLTSLHNIADREENEYAAFMNRGALHMDIVPIPKTVWSNIELLYNFDDISKLKYLRDLLFTCKPLANKWGITSNTVSDYRQNVLLNIFGSTDATSFENAMKIIINNHPHNNLIFIYPEIKENLTNAFKKEYDALIELKRIEITSGITGNGKAYLQELEVKRSQIFKYGIYD